MIRSTPTARPSLPLRSPDREARPWREGSSLAHGRAGEPPLRVAIVGHLKFPIARPFLGGLERFTHALVRGLQRRGVHVTLFASGDSDRSLGLEPLCPRSTVAEGHDRFDECDRGTGGPCDQWIDQYEDRLYADLMQRLSGGDLAGWFDVVHNNSINPVPIDFADQLTAPCTTTLHVPVLPRLEEQIECGGPRGDFINISGRNREQWSRLLPEQSLIPNAVDTTAWVPRPLWRRARAVWFGRILPDKGTHFAIEAAHKAGLPIDIAGPVSDPEYFREEVQPRLSAARGDRYLGACDTDELQRLVARASVCLVTPCWEEPFGLVTAEAMSCGTPVAAFRRGGPAEIVSEASGRLCTPDDSEALADAVRQCLTLDRRGVRDDAVARYDFELMIDRYLAHYRSLAEADRRVPREAARVASSGSPTSGGPGVPVVAGGLEKQTTLA